MRWYGIIAWSGICLLSGCATYAPRSLPTRVDLPVQAATVAVQHQKLPFAQLQTHLYNPADGLDMIEVAMLAVANNPQLRASRDALGVAQAQAFAAGLLPDPQFDMNFDHPTNNVPGTLNGYGYGLNYDVGALLLHSSRKNAATASAKQVNEELLWQEWQVVNQAKLLFVQAVAQDALMQPLVSAHELLLRRYQLSQQALSDGNVTADFASSDLLALQNTGRQINALQRTELQTRASLNGLLGLSAAEQLRLVNSEPPAPIDTATIVIRMQQLLQQRPDMQALRAGYHAQEEKYRGAVLAQFPTLNVGITRMQDTTGIDAMGFGVSLSLPIFNRNRGNVAIEKASRKKLYDEYQARLNSASNEITVALANLPLLEAQQQQVQLDIASLVPIIQRAQSAFDAGNLPVADYVRLETAWLNKQTEAINLTEALAEQRVALETLLGPDLPERSN